MRACASGSPGGGRVEKRGDGSAGHGWPAERVRRQDVDSRATQAQRFEARVTPKARSAAGAADRGVVSLPTFFGQPKKVGPWPGEGRV